MEARIKANGKIIKGRLAEVLVKKGRATDLKVLEKLEKANKAKAENAKIKKAEFGKAKSNDNKKPE